MEFIKSQSKENLNTYIEYLKIVTRLSMLFSESDKPYLNYRVAENVFCKAFGARNWARGDIAFDATKDNYGIGIKTFVLSGSSKLEKVAEFNTQSSLLRRLTGLQKIKKLAELRNERIQFADRACETGKRIYHCIGRDVGILKIFDTNYHLIDEGSLVLISDNDTSLTFKDKYNEYNFNVSKSTLFKKFVVPNDALVVKVEILEDPLSLLKSLPQLNTATKLLGTEKGKFVKLINPILPLVNAKKAFEDSIILPLYSSSNKISGKQPFVPERSQLNQWNAAGRPRDVGEVYIPIPALIHKIKSNFFPDKDVQFTLELPSGVKLLAKVCQQGNKALMTNPNNALAEWLLRSVFELREGELLTYKKLEEVGIDSVRVIKLSSKYYRIEFAKLDSYDEFLLENSG